MRVSRWATFITHKELVASPVTIAMVSDRFG